MPLDGKRPAPANRQRPVNHRHSRFINHGAATPVCGRRLMVSGDYLARHRTVSTGLVFRAGATAAVVCAVVLPAWPAQAQSVMAQVDPFSPDSLSNGRPRAANGERAARQPRMRRRGIATRPAPGRCGRRFRRRTPNPRPAARPALTPATTRKPCAQRSGHGPHRRPSMRRPNRR